MDLQAIRVGLASLMAPHVHAEPSLPGKLAKVPAAVVGLPQLRFHEAFQNGMTRLTIPVFIAVSHAPGEERAQTELLELVVTLRSAIEADVTLAGTVDEGSIVEGWSPGNVEVAGTVYWGGRLDVTAYLEG